MTQRRASLALFDRLAPAMGDAQDVVDGGLREAASGPGGRHDERCEAPNLLGAASVRELA